MGIPRRNWIALLPSVFIPGRASAQNEPVVQDPLPPLKREDVRLPNGKRQSDEILKAEFQKNMEDARVLSGLARSLQEEFEKEDRFVLSLGALKKLDDIEKLTRKIRSRLKHS